MDENLDDQNRLRISNKLKYAYDNFASGVGYIAVTFANGNESIGSCFHIGEGIFIIMKHAVWKKLYHKRNWYHYVSKSLLQTSR